MHAAVVTGVERSERPPEDVKLVSVLHDGGYRPAVTR
jgi:hypothetical protein